MSVFILFASPVIILYSLLALLLYYNIRHYPYGCVYYYYYYYFPPPPSPAPPPSRIEPMSVVYNIRYTICVLVPILWCILRTWFYVTYTHQRHHYDLISICVLREPHARKGPRCTCLYTSIKLFRFRYSVLNHVRRVICISHHAVKKKTDSIVRRFVFRGSYFAYIYLYR